MESFSRKCRMWQSAVRLVGWITCAGAVLSGYTAVVDRFGQVPLMFEESGVDAAGGQQFQSEGPGYRVRVSPNLLEVVFQGNGAGVKAGPQGRKHSGMARAKAGRQFSMELLNGNPGAAAMAEQELPTRVNYFVGNDPERWRTGVITHGRIRYQQVYPGIDLVFYGNQRQLEHDFIVAPGANPGLIRWRFEGTERLELQDDGSLAVWLGSDVMTFRAPEVYQLGMEGERQSVAAGYQLEDRGWEVGFGVAPYDPTRPLVIDPVLVYSSFIGGLGYEQASGVAVDSWGQVYVVGETSSTNFPVVNALWPTHGGGYAGTQNPYGNEAFVAKMGAEGTNLLFATYLGGNGLDAAIAVTLDALDRPIITGLTGSTNFPITSTALQPRIASEEDLGLYLDDVFVVQLSADGSELLYSTYIGGEREDQGLAIASDDAGDIYVAGYTESRDFPVRNNDTEHHDLADAFVLKFKPGATNLTYSMLLGGNDYDFAQGLAVDQQGHAYVVGGTGSSAFPVTNAFQTSYGGGSYDAFLTKLRPGGDGLLFSTFMGGGGQEEGLGIAVDAGNNVWVTGYTGSSAFPVTNALSATKASGRDAFLTKFDPSGQLLYSTFLGGRADDEGWAIAVDAAGSPFVVGMTQSSDFPLTNALQSVYQGNRDVFVSQFSPDGQSLSFSTFLGGQRADEARGLALDLAGNVYVAGYTSSTNFAVAPALTAAQRRYGGGVADGFVLKIVPNIYLTISQPVSGVVVLSWPAGLAGYLLESTPALGTAIQWTVVDEQPIVVHDQHQVIINEPAELRFYRLRRIGS